MSDEAKGDHRLPEGWVHPVEGHEGALLAELEKELPPGHVLAGVPVEAFAESPGSDDVLFRHRDRHDFFTVIHLSWLGRMEINSEHPTVEFSGAFHEFVLWHESIMDFCRKQAARETAQQSPPPLPRARGGHSEGEG